MSLIERLEQAARDCDAVVARSLHIGEYDQTAADYRELLNEAREVAELARAQGLLDW